MIIGVGVDLCSVGRLRVSLQRTPNLGPRLFTPKEIELKAESLAGRFAAKEALAKALGDPRLLSWQEVEVVSDSLQKPHLTITGSSAQALKDRGVISSHLSISHDGGFAVAMVVLEGI